MHQLMNSHQCSPAHRKSPTHWCCNECCLSSESTLISSLFLNETPCGFSGSTLIHMTHAHPEELHLNLVLLSYILSVETKQDTICLCMRRSVSDFIRQRFTPLIRCWICFHGIVFSFPFY